MRPRTPSASQYQPTIFEPDVLLPTQREPAWETTPERKLVLACIEDVLREIERNTTTLRTLARLEPLSAEQRRTRGIAERQLDIDRAWLSTNDEAWPYSAVNLFRTVGLSLDAVRRRVHDWLAGDPATRGRLVKALTNHAGSGRVEPQIGNRPWRGRERRLRKERQERMAAQNGADGA